MQENIVIEFFVFLFEFYRPLIVIIAIVAFVRYTFLLIKKVCARIKAAIHERNMAAVRSSSIKYQQLRSLNFTFAPRFIWDIPSEYNYHATCSSKREFDRFNLHDFFCQTIQTNISSFAPLIRNIRTNQKLLAEYDPQFLQILNTDCAYIDLAKQTNMNMKVYIAFERELLSLEQLKPVSSPLFHCNVSYLSSAGRNSYSSSQTYTFDDLLSCLTEIQQRRSQQNTHQTFVQAERAKMTESLRYDILKRDGFRCRICGATARDGVKLHVDHIIPVSRGGRTEPGNLQTLCERCNRGKSNKL